MVAYGVTRAVDATPVDGITGLVGASRGSVHLDLALVTLEAGEVGDAMANPFEESFFVLGGSPTIHMEGRLLSLQPDDFGYLPVALPHRWENRSDSSATFLRVRSPQPRPTEGQTRLADPGGLDTAALTPIPVDPTDPTMRLVGHFDESHLPAPGPIQMKGFRSGVARNVGLWMLVDEVIGAVHHTLFMVQFAPTGQKVTLGGQHYHPFEEVYYIVDGEAVAHLEAESIPVGPGDAVFAGVNALHGFSNAGDRPVRWIEAQSPSPPTSNAFMFPSQWGATEPGQRLQ